MKNIMKWVMKGVMWTLFCILFALLFTYVTMMLWNWLVPALFNGPYLSFWQALGLLVLSKILFGGFGGSRHCGSGGRHWKHRYYEKLSTMSPEDRERFKARLREKWCSRDSSASSEKTDTSNV